jgi:hypothetical protein
MLAEATLCKGFPVQVVALTASSYLRIRAVRLMGAFAFPNREQWDPIRPW